MERLWWMLETYEILCQINRKLHKDIENIGMICKTYLEKWSSHAKYHFLCGEHENSRFQLMIN